MIRYRHKIDHFFRLFDFFILVLPNLCDGQSEPLNLPDSSSSREVLHGLVFLQVFKLCKLVFIFNS